MNRVYLSGMFSHKEQIKKYGEELAEAGLEVTSSWVGEKAHPHVQASDLTNDYLRSTAILDINDMLKANTLVLFVPTDAEIEVVARRSLARGGRNWETGFFYALVMLNEYLPARIPNKREVVVVGQRESVFHFLFQLNPVESWTNYNLPLSNVKQFDTWEQAKAYLKGDCKYEIGECSKVGRAEPKESAAPTT